MPEFSGWNILGEVLLLVGSAVAMGVVLEAVGISAIIGYLLAGVLLGPSVLDVVGDSSNFTLIAELGVALLLFSIGLEMTPTRLRGFGFRGAIAGIIQVSVTIFAAAGVALLFGLEARVALTLGCMVALSSTAVVARLLTDRGELESNRGRSTLAVLLTQDGSLVPVLILIGLLGGAGEDAAAGVGDQIANAAIGLLVMIAAISVAGIFILPRVFDSMILRRNRDFAIVTAIITCLSAAWGSHALGLSPALGAFVAGVLLARVSISRQIRADTGALRAVFLTLFFASVGMLANVRELIEPEILKSMLAILGVGLVLKIVIAWFAIRVTGGHRRVALASALCLAQFGEFSFVIGTEALQSGIIDAPMFQAAIGASLVSLFAAPLLVAKAVPLSKAIEALLVRFHVWKRIAPPETTPRDEISGHAIVVGYGPAGEEVANTAALAGIVPLVIDMNPRLVAAARDAGYHAEHGDAAQQEILAHAVAERAAALVMTLPEPQIAMATISQFRALNADAIIVARGRYSRFVEAMREAGADHVISEETTAGTLLGATLVSRMTGDTTAAPSEDAEPAEA
ncbi:MAG: hypothetical protein GY911_07670 [Actinomycetales bacterium]|nr:hypothetical protein [Actinomycetales bacterium]